MSGFINDFINGVAMHPASTAYHQHRTSVVAVSDWTDQPRDLTGVPAPHHRELNGLLGVGEKVSGSAPCGGREDVHLGILRDPGTKSMVQLTVGNFAQTPAPHAQRQDRCLTKPRFPEPKFENRIVAG